MLAALPPGEVAVLATVVDVVGSGYRRPGARMLLTRDGGRVGGVSGGCLEADLARVAFALTADGPACVDYDTRGDQEHPAGRYDTGCDGVVRVLVERVDRRAAGDPSHPLSALRAAARADGRAAVATVYRVEDLDVGGGDAVGRGVVSASAGAAGPAVVGDHAVLHAGPHAGPSESAALRGTTLNPQVVSEAGDGAVAPDPGGPSTAAALWSGPASSCVAGLGFSSAGRFITTLAPGPLPRAVRDDLLAIGSGGSSCSKVYELPDGRVHVLLEAVVPPRDLVVFGAGDDVRPLVALAAGLGWRVTVADKRPAWADKRYFPDAAQVTCAPPGEALGRVRLRETTAVVLMTHSVTDDAALLPGVLASPAGYVGLLGPKSRAARLMAELHRRGQLPAAASIARLHAPVGLDLGSAEPVGVALSVLAQIEAYFNGRDGGALAGRTRGIHEPHRRARRDLRDDVIDLPPATPTAPTPAAPIPTTPAPAAPAPTPSMAEHKVRPAAPGPRQGEPGAGFGVEA